MKRRRWIIASLGALGLCVTLGYAVRSSASGIPSKNALSYVGDLEDGNGSVTGSHNVQVVFYDAATAGTNLCQTTTAPVSVVAGHFSVQLPDACTQAVGAHPDVWADVLVDGSDTGRVKIGAVPYAVEANRASSAAGALLQQVVPTGAVMAFNLSACPAGWSPLSSANGRVIVGAGALSVGQTAGSDQVTLTVQEMPSHTHGPGGAVNFIVDEYPTICNGDGYVACNTAQICGGASGTSICGKSATSATGGGQPFDNRQASLALLYCQKN
jgi:hypothetical protein